MTFTGGRVKSVRGPLSKQTLNLCARVIFCNLFKTSGTYVLTENAIKVIQIRLQLMAEIKGGNDIIWRSVATSKLEAPKRRNLIYFATEGRVLFSSI